MTYEQYKLIIEATPRYVTEYKAKEYKWSLLFALQYFLNTTGYQAHKLLNSQVNEFVDFCEKNLHSSHIIGEVMGDTTIEALLKLWADSNNGRLQKAAKVYGRSVSTLIRHWYKDKGHTKVPTLTSDLLDRLPSVVDSIVDYAHQSRLSPENDYTIVMRYTKEHPELSSEEIRELIRKDLGD